MHFILLVVSTVSMFSTVSSQASKHFCCSLPYTTLDLQVLLLTTLMLTVHTHPSNKLGNPLGLESTTMPAGPMIHIVLLTLHASLPIHGNIQVGGLDTMVKAVL